MTVKYLLDGQDCNPVNREGIYIEVNHDQGAIINQPLPHVGIGNLYFVREDIAKVMQKLQNPPGITEGVSFDIQITEGANTETINMYLDLMEELLRSNDGIQVAIKMLQSLDWADDKFNAFTFESMYNETGVGSFIVDGITYSSYQDYFDKRCIFIPYVISTIPNFRDAFMALFSITYVLNEATKVIKELTQWVTPIAGLGVVVGVGQLALEIIYLALLLIALIALILHLFDCLIQPIKYHGAMLFVDLLKIVCEKTGLKFQSSIWTTFPYNQIAYLPEKFNPLEDQNPNSNTIFGITFGAFAKRGFHTPGYAPTTSTPPSSDTNVQKGYYNGVGGDFLRIVKKFCNGKIIIPDQTNNLLLERRDFYPSNPLYQLPNIRQDWNGYNTDELTANIIIKFLDDLNDKNSIDKYLGNILQATHQQIFIKNKMLVNLKGLREITMDGARGVRKLKLNLIENIHKDMYVAFHAIANVGIIYVNILILLANGLIIMLDALITLFDILMNILIAVVKLVNAIVNAISALFGGSGLGTPPNWIPLNNNWVHFIAPIPLLSVNPKSYTDRLDALLLENDIVSTPKILMVDTMDNVIAGRNAFTASGGYSGQKRIAYIHPLNDTVINAQWLWNNFYFIDAFVGAKNNRFTKIAPATNHESDKNPVLMRLADFKNLVFNPKFNDNFGEEVIAEKIQWYIEKNGATDIQFRKAGWLKNPQSNNGAIRSQEISINLQIKTSLPNGQ